MHYFKALIFLGCVVFTSCDDGGPYLKHELSYKSIHKDCNQLDPSIGVIANTIGERYRFQQCLDAGYNGAVEVSRKGDTVVVQFPEGKEGTALYEITLDINTRPDYQYLSINGNTSRVKVTRL